MGCKNFNCRIFQTSWLLIVAFFLMAPILSPLHFTVRGRQVAKLKWRNEENGEMVRMSRRTVIGSRPPKCSGRCKSCGHCEAVQVPIMPIKKSLQVYHQNAINIPRFPYSRGDDISNYKPMSWKCKCGDFFFNPW